MSCCTGHVKALQTFGRHINVSLPERKEMDKAPDVSVMCQQQLTDRTHMYEGTEVGRADGELSIFLIFLIGQAVEFNGVHE